MFGGFITDCGQIKKIEETNDGKRFFVSCAYSDLARGESIAVDGVCLTVTDHGLGYFSCDLSPETLKRTRASTLKAGDLINLERSITLNDRLNGHIVMGHVDQTCVIEQKKCFSDYVQYRVSGVHADAQGFLVYKGSIALNGVSLTLNKVEHDAFEVMLIPETLLKTNLKNMEIGWIVNVEYDYFAKLIAKQMAVARQ